MFSGKAFFLALGLTLLAPASASATIHQASTSYSKIVAKIKAGLAAHRRLGAHEPNATATGGNATGGDGDGTGGAATTSTCDMMTVYAKFGAISSEACVKDCTTEESEVTSDMPMCVEGQEDTGVTCKTTKTTECEAALKAFSAEDAKCMADAIPDISAGMLAFMGINIAAKCGVPIDYSQYKLPAPCTGSNLYAFMQITDVTGVCVKECMEDAAVAPYSLDKCADGQKEYGAKCQTADCQALIKKGDAAAVINCMVGLMGDDFLDGKTKDETAKEMKDSMIDVCMVGDTSATTAAPAATTDSASVLGMSGLLAAGALLVWV